MAKKRATISLRQKIYLFRLFLLVSLFTLIVFASSAAFADVVRWTKVNIPTEGTAGNWVLADGSDIQHLTMADDGTLFAYGKGLTYTLYKSTNGGYSWLYVGNVQDNIVDIAIAPDNTDHVYYATA